MDVAVVKTKKEYVAFSLFPVGVMGWGNSKSVAISQLNDNLYDYCNWLGCKLPKEPLAKVVAEYSGEICEIKFLQDDGKSLKKYCEIAYQTAFSYKCMMDSFCGYEHPLHPELLRVLGAETDGVIGVASKLCEGENLAKIREFIYLTYKTAKEIYFCEKQKGRIVTDSFRWDI